MIFILECSNTQMLDEPSKSNPMSTLSTKLVSLRRRDLTARAVGFCVPPTKFTSHSTGYNRWLHTSSPTHPNPTPFLTPSSPSPPVTFKYFLQIFEVTLLSFPIHDELQAQIRFHSLESDACYCPCFELHIFIYPH